MRTLAAIVMFGFLQVSVLLAGSASATAPGGPADEQAGAKSPGPEVTDSTPPEERLKSDEITSAVIAQVEALAGDQIPDSVAFAMRLVAVLTDHGVELPDGLRKIEEPKPQATPVTPAEIDRVFQKTRRIMEKCEKIKFFGYFDADIVSLAALRDDLLLAISMYCPSALGRVEAARALATRAIPGADGKGPQDVSPSVVEKAVIAAIDHALHVADGRLGPDAEDALKLILWRGLAVHALVLRATSLENPSEAALDSYVAGLKDRVAAAEKSLGQDNAERQTLKALRERLDKIGSRTKEYAKLFADMSPVRAVLVAFFKIANEEDRAAAQTLLSAKTAVLLSEDKTPLKDWITNTRDVKEVRFLDLGPIKMIGPQYYTDVRFIVLDKQGRQKINGLVICLTKSDRGWLIGE